VALDRRSIARSDFPAARRGYDPGAVDRHLAAIADEVEELRRRTAGPGAALAAQTSDQVRAIIEAAESSAAGIRDSAAKDARAHVERVAEAADALRERIDALEREVTGLLGTLRGGADRLRSDLEAVADGTARLAAAGGGGSPADEVAPSALGATLGEAAAAAPADEEVGEEPALAAVEEAPAKAAGRSTDVLGAKIVALELATQGRPRDEIERHLAEHYDLDDPAGLIDGVYARVAKT
jgi:cell division septum initiation protein DivIVA